MILADKLIRLRKKNGWSQEDLAEKMDVSRQAVSKWESAQTLPDLEKILQLSILFGVTTDYLLKNEIEDEEYTENVSNSGIKHVSLQEAMDYIEWRKRASVKIAGATFLCIFSVIAFLGIAGIAEVLFATNLQSIIDMIGLIVMFILISIAVAIFIFCGFQNSPYVFLEENIPFELEYGVKTMVQEKQSAYRNVYVKYNILATCLCVLSPIPLCIGACFEKESILIFLLCVTMLIVGIGVYIFIVIGIRWASMQKLLKEGEYTQKEKKKSRIKEMIGYIYWMIIVSIYLIWSFLSNDWHITWLVFVVGGILFPAIISICNFWLDKKDTNEETYKK